MSSLSQFYCSTSVLVLGLDVPQFPRERFLFLFFPLVGARLFCCQGFHLGVWWGAVEALDFLSPVRLQWAFG